MSHINPQSGLIQLIVIIVIAILVISYFGFSLRDLGEDETTKDNFSFVTEWLSVIWQDYLKEPAVWIWDNIISFIWNNLFLDNLQRLQSGENFGDIAPESPTIEN